MPVENSGLIFPKADVQYETPEGPVTVEFDDGHTLKAKDMTDLGEPTTVDHSDLHTPRSTDQFETPGPETVTLSGYTDEQPSEDAKPAKKAAPKQSRGKHEGPDQDAEK